MTARLAKASQRYRKAFEGLRSSTERLFPLGCHIETTVAAGRRATVIRCEVIGHAAWDTPATVIVRNVRTKKDRRIDVRFGETRMVKRAPRVRS